MWGEYHHPIKCKGESFDDSTVHEKKENVNKKHI